MKFLTDETNEDIEDEIEAMVVVLAKKLKKQKRSKLVKINFSGHYPFDMDVDTTMTVEEVIQKVQTVYYVRKLLLF